MMKFSTHEIGQNLDDFLHVMKLLPEFVLIMGIKI
jgi:hypothetical protein